MIIEIILLLVLLYIIYLPIKRTYSLFEDAGVPTEKPVPIFGNLWRPIFRKRHMVLEAQRLYNDCGDSRTRYVGLFSFFTPIIMIKDPELFKTVTVKEFDSFMERQTKANESLESLFNKNLANLKGQKWRDMRATLSPAFTSSKIRDMCPFISDIGKQMVEYLRECCRTSGLQGDTSVEIELKDLSCRYMNDVIASAAYGIKIDSFKNSKNEFFTMGNKILNFTPSRTLKILLSSNFPKLAQLLKIRLFPKEMNDFFRSIVTDSMKYREENNIIRRDMIHLLMEAKKGTLKRDDKGTDKDAGFSTVEESDVGINDSKRVWSDDDLIAQAMLFFFAGFDSTATLMSFLFVELAANHEVQEKLHREVDDYAKKNGRDYTYDMIQSMKYMDMVVSEALRKWSPGTISDRVCVKDFNLGPATDTSDVSYTVKKSDLIWLPIYAIHRDPNYWPDPDKFDPERFSEENKDKIIPYTYLPFGSGPRNCIGSRFALMEAKCMLFDMVYNFKFEVCSKTTIPFELDATSFQLKLKNGFWVKLSERKLQKK